MTRIRLLHWKAAESLQTQTVLAAAGFEVEYDELCSSAHMREWRQNPPYAFVIDLSRLPSQGLEIAIALRQSPKTRTIPIVFCEGLAEKVERVRNLLPDACFCTLTTLVETLQTARPVEAPLKPAAMMERYGTRTTYQKLGLTSGTSVQFIDPPKNVYRILGELPPDITLTEEGAAVTLCFVHSVDGLKATMSRVRPLAIKTRLWILHQKKSSPQHRGVTEQLVRDTGIDLGLVDYKICSVNKDWSGMLFARRRAISHTFHR
jgi:CheY-like chemotaxis protein